MKKLLIVESPAKIKTISKFLGKDFKVLSTRGHIMDLPSKELGVTINGSIDVTYVVLEGKEKVISDIVREAKNADDIYLAPDPDREGEIIAWHVAQALKKSIKEVSKKIHRIAFNEITKSAVQKALDAPGKIDLHKVEAQQARRILDRWVGYEVSPILWRKIATGLSAGRVQSVALKLICDREEQIRAFKPEEYWTIEGLFALDKETNLLAALVQIGENKAEISNEADAKKIVTAIKKQSYSIAAIKDSERKKNPPAPFMTSTLQQVAYNSLGFSVDKTMQLAQQLYEGVPLEDASAPTALITYMRTDSQRIADSALSAVRTYITDEFGEKYLPEKENIYSKAGQDAHEAIRPIDVSITPETVKGSVPKDLAKLYDLIWKRFVSCQMNPAEYAQRQVTIEGGEFKFRATGSTLLFDGFLRVWQEKEEEENGSGATKLPENLAEGQETDLKKIDPQQHFTQAPPRYSQATLVKELEKEGIGRPSTYATILKTIQARSYTTLEKKRFVPTELGMAVTKMLSENLPKIMNLKFTAVMEEDLDKIASGDLERDILLRAFHTDFEKDLEVFSGEQKRAGEVTDVTCPTCKKAKLLIRFGKSGPFLGCQKYPECKFTSNFTRNEDGTITIVKTPKPQLLDEKCPNCDKQMRQMVGRFGPFVSCSGYPECKYIKKEIAHFPCPECGGELNKRSWKGRIFWGCASYPKCKFSISGDIEQTKCPKCKKSPYLLKRTSREGITTISCPRENCEYSKEVAPDEE